MSQLQSIIKPIQGLTKLKLVTPRIGLRILFWLFMSFAASKAQAQDDVDYSVHANIIYHFTKYIDWPPSKKSGDFIIGVVGDSPITDELKKAISNKKAGSQNIIIKKFTPSSSNFTCHLLFISEEESSSMKKIASITKDEPILLVSEAKGLAQKGSCINFIIVREKLKLEINKENIVQRGLSVASELLKLGIPVK